MRRLFVRAS